MARFVAGMVVGAALAATASCAVKSEVLETPFLSSQTAAENTTNLTQLCDIVYSSADSVQPLVDTGMVVKQNIGPRAQNNLVIRENDDSWELSYDYSGPCDLAEQIKTRHQEKLTDLDVTVTPVSDNPIAYGLGRTHIGTTVQFLETQLRDQGKLNDDETLGVYVNDLRTGKKIVGLNEDTPFTSASTAKPFFALAYLVTSTSEEKGVGFPIGKISLKRIDDALNYGSHWEKGNHNANKLLEYVARGNGHKGDSTQGAIQTGNVMNYLGLSGHSFTEQIPDQGRSYKNTTTPQVDGEFMYGLVNEAFDVPPINLVNAQRKQTGESLSAESIVLNALQSNGSPRMNSIFGEDNYHTKTGTTRLVSRRFAMDGDKEVGLSVTVHRNNPWQNYPENSGNWNRQRHQVVADVMGSLYDAARIF